MRLYLKDYVTLMSLVAGVVSMALVVEGNLHGACLFVWLAWVFDAFDGLVARLTGKGNALGGHLDAAVDFVGCALAPGMCVYLGYRELLGFYGAVALGSVPVIFGTIRHARNYANPPRVSNLWVGLPRSYSGMAIAGLLGSHLFVGREIQYAGIGLIVVLSVLNITTLPYQGRHHAGLKWHQILCLVLTLLTWAFGIVMATLGYGLSYFFDGLFFWMGGYALAAWRGMISSEERREYAEYIAQWKKGFD
jgi:CDP-diacylglycerol--serine O-phosphatidyltransferase